MFGCKYTNSILSYLSWFVYVKKISLLSRIPSLCLWSTGEFSSLCDSCKIRHFTYKIIFNFHNNLHQTEIDLTNCIKRSLIGFSNIYFLMTFYVQTSTSENINVYELSLQNLWQNNSAQLYKYGSKIIFYIQ